MKRKVTLAFATMVAVLFFQTNSLKLKSDSAQPLYGGLSGDPGQTTCVHCHSDITSGIVRPSQWILKIAPDSAGLVGNANVITGSSTYIPGCTQWISIQLLGQNTNAEPTYLPKQGFQFTALKTVGDSMAGSFEVVDPKTTTQTSVSSFMPVMYGPVTYMSHRNADSSTHTWYFKWTAPASGSVTFYYTGNLGNGDGTYNGDSIFVGTATLTPGTSLCTTGLANVPGNIASSNVFPVPFENSLNTDLYLNAPADLTLTLLSMEGQVIRELYKGAASQGQFSRSFEIGNVSPGIYLVNIQSGNDSKVVKVLKY